MSTLIECGASPFYSGVCAQGCSSGENGLTVEWLSGSGSPLLLLHGHPQEILTTWRKVAPTLAQNQPQSFCPDLRGYGDGDEASERSAHYSKAHHGAGYRHVNGRARLFPFAFGGAIIGGRVGFRARAGLSGSCDLLYFIDIAQPDDVRLDR